MPTHIVIHLRYMIDTVLTAYPVSTIGNQVVSSIYYDSFKLMVTYGYIVTSLKKYLPTGNIDLKYLKVVKPGLSSKK